MFRKKTATIVASILLAFSFMLIPALPASAADVFTGCSNGGLSNTDVCKDVNSTTGNPIIHTIKDIINIVSFAIGVAAIIVIIISGLRMVISSGDVKAVEQARSGIIYA